MAESAHDYRVSLEYPAGSPDAKGEIFLCAHEELAKRVSVSIRAALEEADVRSLAVRIEAV